MCQICQVGTVAKGERWPKPMAPHTDQLNEAFTTAHTDFDNLRKTASTDLFTRARAKASLVDDVKTLLRLFLLLEEERVTWWHSDEKKLKRRALEEAGDAKQLQRLQVINQKTTDMICDMRAKLGMLGKYTLAIDVDAMEAQIEAETARAVAKLRGLNGQAQKN